MKLNIHSSVSSSSTTRNGVTMKKKVMINEKFEHGGKKLTSYTEKTQ